MSNRMPLKAHRRGAESRIDTKRSLRAASAVGSSPLKMKVSSTPGPKTHAAVTRQEDASRPVVSISNAIIPCAAGAGVLGGSGLSGVSE